MAFLVDFRFCGGCNSRYDRNEVYHNIRKNIEDKALERTLNDNNVLVILNGCQRGCISSQKYQTQYDNIINSQWYLSNNYNNDSNSITNWIIGSIEKLNKSKL